jgi:hypothetical protein
LALGENVMSAKHRCNWDGAPKGPYRVNSLLRAGSLSRPALLASVSLIVLAALGAPSAARAACSGKNQTISSPSTPGPIFGKGGNITVHTGASVAGGPTRAFRAARAALG